MNNSISEIARIWQQTLKVIDKKLGERDIFDSFFANSYIQDIKGNTVTVVVGSATAERLLSSRYVDVIKDSLGEVTDNNYDLVFVQQDSIAKSNVKNVFAQKEESEPSFFKDARLDQNLTFESFVEGAFNIEAYKVLQNIQESVTSKYALKESIELCVLRILITSILSFPLHISVFTGCNGSSL